MQVVLHEHGAVKMINTVQKSGKQKRLFSDPCEDMDPCTLYSVHCASSAFRSTVVVAWQNIRPFILAEDMR